MVDTLNPLNYWRNTETKESSPPTSITIMYRVSQWNSEFVPFRTTTSLVTDLVSSTSETVEPKSSERNSYDNSDGDEGVTKALYSVSGEE